MKTILYFCNTYYQLIVFLQLKLTRDKNNDVTLVITNRLKNAICLVESLSRLHIFTEVIYVDFKPKYRRITHFFNCIFGNNICRLKKDKIYSEFVAFNFELESHWEFAYLYRKNNKLRCVQIEEGLLSYETGFDKTRLLKLIYFCRKIIGQKNMRNLCSEFLCFRPELYKGILKPVKIEQITKASILRKTLSSIFNDGLIDYTNKFVYLSSVYNVDGSGGVDETTVIKALCNLVGKNNFILKVHPRDNIDKFASLGCVIDNKFCGPVEALVLSGNAEKCVFITALSGALLNISSLGGNCKCIYLTEMVDCSKNALAAHFKERILCYKKRGIKNIFFINNLKEIKKI